MPGLAGAYGWAASGSEGVDRELRIGWSDASFVSLKVIF